MKNTTNLEATGATNFNSVNVLSNGAWNAKRASSRGTNAQDGRRGISIPDVRAAIFNLVGLVVVMALLGHYVLVQMPGVGGAELRAVMIPSHPANMPAGMLVNHVSPDSNLTLLQTVQAYFSSF